jgi:hypothetical protein
VTAMSSFFDAAGIGAVRISVTRTGTRAQGAQSPRAAPSVVLGLLAKTDRKGKRQHAAPQPVRIRAQQPRPQLRCALQLMG